MIAETIALTIVLSTPSGAALSRVEAGRYAADIAAVAEDVEQASALATVAHFEGSYRRDVETCKVTGDQGRAISLYQLHPHHLGRHTRAEVCGSNRVATKIAANVLGQLRRVVGTWRGAFARYAGSPKPDDPRIVKRDALFQRLIAKHQETP